MKWVVPWWRKTRPYTPYSEKTYVDKDGIKRKLSYKVGYIRIRDDGSKFIPIYCQPDTCFRVVTPDEEETVENTQ
ncbi:MAG: hypothetical protein GC180_08315 [Bacteroidetes bacterium]|nr:hypothetical protein [Bacteroidota bacterium]